MGGLQMVEGEIAVERGAQGKKGVDGGVGVCLRPRQRTGQAPTPLCTACLHRTGP